jgi:excisionase family DNA binding protein
VPGVLGSEVHVGMRRDGHSPGTVPREPRVGAGQSGGAPDRQTARLMSIKDASSYLGLSPWTVRDLIASGVLPRVRLPLGGARDVRRVLLDRVDLDKLIAQSKENGS